jgi:hypothetical protein
MIMDCCSYSVPVPENLRFVSYLINPARDSSCRNAVRWGSLSVPNVVWSCTFYVHFTLRIYHRPTVWDNYFILVPDKLKCCHLFINPARDSSGWNAVRWCSLSVPNVVWSCTFCVHFTLRIYHRPTVWDNYFTLVPDKLKFCHLFINPARDSSGWNAVRRCSLSVPNVVWSCTFLREIGRINRVHSEFITGRQFEIITLKKIQNRNCYFHAPSKSVPTNWFKSNKAACDFGSTFILFDSKVKRRKAVESCVLQICLLIDGSGFSQTVCW